MFANWKAIRALAFVLVSSLTLVNIVIAKPALMGRLRTRDNRSVQLNGVTVKSGTTVFSGARISCPDKTGATVDLPTLGRIDVTPNTRLVLTFSENLISVRLESGYVLLSTQKGVKGSVTTDDVKVVITDSSKNSSIIARTAGSAGPEASVLVGAAGGIGAGTVAASAAAAAAVVAGAVTARTGDRGKSLSPGSPNQ
jgi:hypothetical protein